MGGSVAVGTHVHVRDDWPVRERAKTGGEAHHDALVGLAHGHGVRVVPEVVHRRRLEADEAGAGRLIEDAAIPRGSNCGSGEATASRERGEMRSGEAVRARRVDPPRTWASWRQRGGGCSSGRVAQAERSTRLRRRGKGWGGQQRTRRSARCAACRSGGMAWPRP